MIASGVLVMALSCVRVPQAFLALQPNRILCLHTASDLQVTSLDFDKEREASMHAATLLGGFVKSAASLLLGAPPDAAANLPLPQELLHDQVTVHACSCVVAMTMLQLHERLHGA